MSMKGFYTHTERITAAIRSRTGCAMSGIPADTVVSAQMPDGRIRFIFHGADAAAFSALPPFEWWRILDCLHYRAFRVAAFRQLNDGTVTVEADQTKPFVAECREYFNGMSETEIDTETDTAVFHG